MRIFRLTAVVVIALAISSCATSEPADEAAPTASATPAPTATAEPQPVGPQLVLDGDCDALTTAAALSADVGAPFTLSDQPWITDVAYSAIPQLGGIYCVWAGATNEDASASLIVLPAAAITEGEVSATECSTGTVCSFELVESGFRLSGVVYVPNGDPARVRASVDAIAARLTPVLASAVPPTPYEVVGAWASDLDCATLDQDAAIGAVLGDPLIVGYPYGGDAEGNVGFYRALGASGLTHCVWVATPVDTGASVTVDLMPGGGWSYARVEQLPDASVVDVPGFEHAFVWRNTLHGYTATNRLSLTLDPGESGIALDAFYPAATALAAELDAR